ncbi:MAG: hypothetical protein Q8O16_00620 [Dehalococcoidia bacterium]|nr:hypothetical protein [Dehalococcoidia bacterium]
MKRISGYILGKLIPLVMVSVILMFSGCTTSKGEGFAIYLTREDIPVARMPVLSHVEIAKQPVISIIDVIEYDEKTHEMLLTPSAYERISKLEVPVSGRSFVVCVNRSPIYWGAFWTLLSSIPFDGVVILKPVVYEEDGNSIWLNLGYPSQQFFTGEDPRLNAEVMKSLEQAGKLK